MVNPKEMPITEDTLQIQKEGCEKHPDQSYASMHGSLEPALMLLQALLLS